MHLDTTYSVHATAHNRTYKALNLSGRIVLNLKFRFNVFFSMVFPLPCKFPTCFKLGTCHLDTHILNRFLSFFFCTQITYQRLLQTSYHVPAYQHTNFPTPCKLSILSVQDQSRVATKKRVQCTLRRHAPGHEQNIPQHIPGKCTRNIYTCMHML